MFSWKLTNKPIIALAPMDGYTDSAFRQLVKQIEPRTLCFTEFISSDFLFFRPQEYRKFLTFTASEQPLVVQLFGKDPEHFREAARVAEQSGAAAVDINMGCPAKKVVASMHGSYLMKHPDLGCKIIEEIKKVVSIPVSVKTRLGWEDDTNLIPFVKGLINAGIDAITIHGRTYKQGFHGEACWDAIYQLKKEISIPVIGNGDVKDSISAKEKLGNLDGVMIGRGCFGNPWIFKEIASALLDQTSWQSEEVSLQERLRVMQEHTALLLQTKGDTKGILESRKHLAAYIKGVRGAADFRNRLVRINNQGELDGIIHDIQVSVSHSSL